MVLSDREDRGFQTEIPLYHVLPGDAGAPGPKSGPASSSSQQQFRGDADAWAGRTAASAGGRPTAAHAAVKPALHAAGGSAVPASSPAKAKAGTGRVPSLPANAITSPGVHTNRRWACVG